MFCQLNNKLAGFEPVLDSTGKITGYKTDVGGADTVFPFNKSFDIILNTQGTNNTGGVYLPLDMLESVVLKSSTRYIGSNQCETWISANYVTTKKQLGKHGHNDGKNVYNYAGKNILDILGDPGNNKYLLIIASDANIYSAVDFTLTVTLK